MSERMTEARARLEVLADDDRRDERIDPRYIGRSFLPDDVAPIAVVLLHGLSNAPPQYDRLATQLAARGHAVLVPRLPYHGYRDRLTDALADLRAVDMEQTALEALTIAALCGERVVVLGVSVFLPSPSLALFVVGSVITGAGIGALFKGVVTSVAEIATPEGRAEEEDVMTAIRGTCRRSPTRLQSEFIRSISSCWPFRT